MFNNKLTKNDPLVALIESTMSDTKLRNYAVELVNEAYGIEARAALPFRDQPGYDADVESVYAELKESNCEGTDKDKAEDKKLAKKHGMSMKQWEKSDADKKHDAKEKCDEEKEETYQTHHKNSFIRDSGKAPFKGGREHAKKDYDKDGKVESPKDEVWGSRLRAAKKAGKMEEESNWEGKGAARSRQKAAAYAMRKTPVGKRPRDSEELRKELDNYIPQSDSQKAAYDPRVQKMIKSIHKKMEENYEQINELKKSTVLSYAKIVQDQKFDGKVNPGHKNRYAGHKHGGHSPEDKQSTRTAMRTNAFRNLALNKAFNDKPGKRYSAHKLRTGDVPIGSMGGSENARVLAKESEDVHEGWASIGTGPRFDKFGDPTGNHKYYGRKPPKPNKPGDAEPGAGDTYKKPRSEKPHVRTVKESHCSGSAKERLAASEVHAPKEKMLHLKSMKGQMAVDKNTDDKFNVKSLEALLRKLMHGKKLAEGMEDAVGSVKTKGGDFKIYNKASKTAADFRSTYANAKGNFTWQGRQYAKPSTSATTTPSTSSNTPGSTSISKQPPPRSDVSTSSAAKEVGISQKPADTFANKFAQNKDMSGAKVPGADAATPTPTSNLSSPQSNIVSKDKWKPPAEIAGKSDNNTAQADLAGAGIKAAAGGMASGGMAFGLNGPNTSAMSSVNNTSASDAVNKKQTPTRDAGTTTNSTMAESFNILNKYRIV